MLLLLGYTPSIMFRPIGIEQKGLPSKGHGSFLGRATAKARGMVASETIAEGVGLGLLRFGVLFVRDFIPGANCEYQVIFTQPGSQDVVDWGGEAEINIVPEHGGIASLLRE